MEIKKIIKSSPLVWRLVLNGSAYRSFAFKPNTALSPKFNELLLSLTQKGISFSSFETIFTGIDFEDFVQMAEQEKQNYFNTRSEYKNDEKDFMHFLLGIHPTYEPNSMYARLAEHPGLKAIADSYFGMRETKMRYYNLWVNTATGKEASGSQLWHRDREDLQILKIFIYLTDVDETKGPFTYAPSTHLKGSIKRDPAFFYEHGVRRTNDEQMNMLIPKEKWIKALGKKGTVVLADTHGYHKGGFVQDGERLLFTCMYVSPACGRRYFQQDLNNV